MIINFCEGMVRDRLIINSEGLTPEDIDTIIRMFDDVRRKHKIWNGYAEEGMKEVRK